MLAIIIASAIMGKPNLTTCPKNRKHYRWSPVRGGTKRLESIYQQKLAALDTLKKSLLDKAFTGQLVTV
jgi:hypothetical protein